LEIEAKLQASSPWAKYTTGTVAQAKQNKILSDQTQISDSLFDERLLSFSVSPIEHCTVKKIKNLQCLKYIIVDFHSLVIVFSKLILLTPPPFLTDKN
jgi:hypothetical protein